MFFRSPSPFCFVQCSRILSLWVILFPENSFPEQVSHSSNISNSWGLQDNFNIPSSFNVQDSQMIISAPSKWLGHFSSSALSITLSYGSLHSTSPSVLATHPRVLVSSVGWVLLLQLGLTHSLPYVYSMVPNLSCSACQLHTFGTNTTWVILTHDQVQLNH